VTYAIGNVDPFSGLPQSLKRRVKRRLQTMLARYVWKRLSAVAYGTDVARDVYHSVLPPRPGLDEALIPALPARAELAFDGTRDESVVFLGAFVARKGLPLVMEAWRRVVAERPGAALTLVGKGALLDDVRRFAAEEPTVRLVVDPPRHEIREILVHSRVLVLPSQPSPTWREQVGLPIVEGLEQGCAIVTTTETGLAPWLHEHGHAVVAGNADAEVLARAIIGQIDAGDRAASIVASLPPVDGRLAADAWMFGDAPATARGTGRHG
jgi:glycosyltransferase involved in cell wall biosynthesis